MKKTKSILALIISAILILSNSALAVAPAPIKVVPKLVVRYINVGQGDSELIQTPSGKNVLIDAGPDSSEKNLILYLQKLNIKTIDCLIATHPHEDHIGGMDGVVKTFKIGQILMPAVSDKSKSYNDLITAMKNKGYKQSVAKAGLIINVGTGATAQLLAPISNKYKDLNDYSAVLKLSYGKTSFMFDGDATKVSEAEMLAKKYNVKADVLKVGHHGSNTSSSSAFIKAVSPKYSIIEVGKNNKYHHPVASILSFIASVGSKICRTDTSGTITVTSNGTAITVDKAASVVGKTVPVVAPVKKATTSYIGNKESHIFHRTNCSKLPGAAKQVKLTSRDQALKTGYKPCKICKP